MLADGKGDTALGRLDAEVQLPSTAKRVILDFIAHELSSWRDHPQRPPQQAEDRLTESLCDHLNTAAYNSTHMSNIRFHAQAGDETNAARTVDLAVKPIGATLVIQGRRSTIFDTILPIECKRLPTPSGTDRDHREYVFSAKKSTGGIQRFKEGNHGADHAIAAMIGYVQQDTCAAWHSRTTEWIEDLIASKQRGWSAADQLRLEHSDLKRKVTMLSSCHTRSKGRADLELRHLWIEMN